MSYFQFRRLSDNKIRKYDSNGLEVIIDTKTKLLPIHNKNNQYISTSVIEEYGWVKEQVTDAVIEYEKFAYFYEHSDTLKDLVLALKATYDDLGASYTVSGPIMEDLVLVKYPTRATEKLVLINDQAEALAAELLKCYHLYLNDKTTHDDVNPVGTWSLYLDFPKLIQWIPGTYTEEDIPQKVIIHE